MIHRVDEIKAQLKDLGLNGALNYIEELENYLPVDRLIAKLISHWNTNPLDREFMRPFLEQLAGMDKPVAPDDDPDGEIK